MDSLDPETLNPFVLVLGLDLADTASSGFAFEQASRIAPRIAKSRMHVVYVLNKDSSPAVTREAVGLLQHYVTGQWAALGQTSRQTFGVHVRCGDAAREIAQLATEVSADMIIVGSHKVPHLKTIFMGSTAERVMATAHCPVVVAGPRPPPVPSHVIVIEPACSDCLTRRAATGGREWWCERHSEHHLMGHRHVYSYQSELPFGESDMAVSAVRPD
jgi:nucleotide-binding universal stress UspA family protein